MDGRLQARGRGFGGRGPLRLRLVAGLDLEVRLLGDLAPGQAFLELLENLAPLHRCHRWKAMDAIYLSFSAISAAEIREGARENVRSFPSDHSGATMNRASALRIPADLFRDMNATTDAMVLSQDSRR